MADLSVIITSHNKPRFAKEAVQSLLDQTHHNWQGILVDSGVLLNQGFFNYLNDPRLKLVRLLGVGYARVGEGRHLVEHIGGGPDQEHGLLVLQSHP